MIYRLVRIDYLSHSIFNTCDGGGRNRRSACPSVHHSVLQHPFTEQASTDRTRDEYNRNLQSAPGVSVVSEGLRGQTVPASARSYRPQPAMQ
ncbi:hypothetical protein BaRGS_00022208 [Batillaria attramentaria]|uniref:Uncharacterized protein n=1 Tax=Batillaria attramentaria TaxID=370345 RepID=A0ABD0KHM7_9CAEN